MLSMIIKGCSLQRKDTVVLLPAVVSSRGIQPTNNYGLIYGTGPFAAIADFSINQ